MLSAQILAADGADFAGVFQPWLIFVIVAVVMATNTIRGALKRRARTTAAPGLVPPAPVPRPGQGQGQSGAGKGQSGAGKGQSGAGKGQSGGRGQAGGPGQAVTQAHPAAGPGGSGAPGPAGHAPLAPVTATLLNGVPLPPYATPYGVLPTPVPNERVRAEAALKRQLDALDTARRSGQVSAEQYAAHREAIFKAY